MSRKMRKLIWSAPLIAAVAVIGALALFVTLAPNAAQADHVDLPGIVTDVKADADGRDSVDLTWKAPATGGDPDYYRIDRSPTGDVWTRLVQMHTGDLSYTDDTVKPGKTYHYRVFAVNLAGTGPSSDLNEDSQTNTDGAESPGPVRMLTAKVVGPNQIDLSWYSPTDDGGSDITRYCISAAGGATVLGDPTAANCAHDTTPNSPDEASTATGAGIIVIRAPESAGKVEYMHEDLPASNRRQYEVYAVNSVGFSDAATAVVPVPSTADPGKPGKPILRAVASDDGAGNLGVELYWTWPEETGGADIVNFAVDIKTGNGAWDSEDADGLTTGRDAIVPTANAVGYEAPDITATTYYRVRANNGTKNSDWSAVATIRVTAATTDPVVAEKLTNAPPAMVTGLSASTDDYLRQIDLKWTDIRSTSFLIDVSTDDGATWKAVQGDTGYTDAEYEHTGLTPDRDNADDATAIGSDNDSPHDYVYRVFPRSAAGAYGPLAPIKGSTIQASKPAAVRGLKTSSDDPTEILLEWDKPTENGGYDITGYRVEISAYDGFTDTDPRVTVTHPSEDCEAPTASPGYCAREVDGADTTMFTLDGLDAGSDRWFRVFAINKVSEDDTGDTTIANNFPDEDDIGQAHKIKGTSDKAGTPGMPLDLTVQPARDASEDDPSKLGIDILWNAPGDPAGDTVTGYVIARRVKESTTASWGAWDDDWGSISEEGSDFLRTHFTDTEEPEGLADGEMREYMVTAKSGSGSGPETDAVVYPVDTSHEPVVGPEVGPATSVTTGPFNEGGVIQVNWDAAPNATGYIIYAVNVDELDQDDGQVVVVPVNDAAAETFNLGGLNSGDTYDIYVVATAKEMVAWPASDDVVQVAAN